MKVVIAGGHGKVALRLARRLVARGDEVRSLIRNPDQRGDVAATGAEPVLCDLEQAGAEEVAARVAGADAVVFAAGAGPGSGPLRKETVDYGGAVKLIEAARIANVRRYVMLSSMGADPAAGEGAMSAYLRAKGRADEALRASGLEWTIVAPGPLSEEPGEGRVALGDEAGRAALSRDDLAEVLAAVLHAPATGGLTVRLSGGGMPVAEAVEHLTRGSG